MAAVADGKRGTLGDVPKQPPPRPPIEQPDRPPALPSGPSSAAFSSYTGPGLKSPSVGPSPSVSSGTHTATTAGPRVTFFSSSASASPAAGSPGPLSSSSKSLPRPSAASSLPTSGRETRSGGGGTSGSGSWTGGGGGGGGRVSLIADATGGELARAYLDLRAWIDALLRTPPPAAAAAAGSSIESWAMSLADGVKLCQVMQALDERSVPRIHTGPGGAPLRQAFKILENLTCFVEAAREYGLSLLNCVKPSEAANAGRSAPATVRLLETLLALAEQAQRRHVRPPFRPAAVSPSPALLDEAARLVAAARASRFRSAPADIPLDSSSSSFSSSSSAASSSGPSSSLGSPRRGPAPSNPTSSSSSSLPRANKPLPPVPSAAVRSTVGASPSAVAGSGQRGVGVGGASAGGRRGGAAAPSAEQRLRAAVRIQAWVRGHLCRLQYRKMRRAQAYRDRVAQEILSSEQSYVAALSTLMCASAGPCSAS